MWRRALCSALVAADPSAFVWAWRLPEWLYPQHQWLSGLHMIALYCDISLSSPSLDMLQFSSIVVSTFNWTVGDVVHHPSQSRLERRRTFSREDVGMTWYDQMTWTFGKILPRDKWLICVGCGLPGCCPGIDINTWWGWSDRSSITIICTQV